MFRCEECGSELPVGAEICQECGAKVELSEEEIKDLQSEIASLLKEVNGYTSSLLNQELPDEKRDILGRIKEKLDNLQEEYIKVVTTSDIYVEFAKEAQYEENYNKAIEYYDKALDLDSTKPHIWCNKGVALAELGSYEEALECFDKAINLDPKFPEAWINKGLVLFEIEGEKEIDDIFRQAESGKRKKKGKYFAGLDPEKQEQAIADALGDSIKRVPQESIEDLFGYTGDAMTKSVAYWIRNNTRFETSSHKDGTITIWNPEEQNGNEDG